MGAVGTIHTIHMARVDYGKDHSLQLMTHKHCFS